MNTDAPAAPSRADQLSASPRLFDNIVLDKLSRIHWTFPLLYLPLVGWLLWRAAPLMPVWQAFAALIGGYVFWTFCEYVAHRWLFHWEPPGKIGERIHFLLHGVHHVLPSDPLRLVMPPLMSVPLMGFAAFVISAVLDAPLRDGVIAGFLIGYVLYDEIHYHIHHRTPRTKLELWLRKLHLQHHFRDPERGYGVSAPYWDYIFGTALKSPDRSTVDPH